MSQVFSSIRSYLSPIVSNGEKGLTTSWGDSPVPHRSPELVTSNNTENDATTGEQGPSHNVIAGSESEAPQERQESVVGDWTEKGERTRPHGDLGASIYEQPLSDLTSTAESGVREAPGGGSTPSQGRHQTFALIIGINEYKFIEPRQDLCGAVEDADSFEKYLEGLLVPKTNIINLRNERATRSAIIKGFRQLQNNPEIIPGEVAIIIYFAGHGAVTRKPEAWTEWVIPTNEIEMLCPADLNQDINGQDKVEGIPDRTLSQLLLDLSNVKGNNITLILDCCHAAGQTRNAGAQMRPRAVGLQNLTLSPTCDKDIYSHALRTKSVQQDGESGFSDSYGSHVLLAACKRAEIAWEKGENGIFTTALLESLRSFAQWDPPPSYDLLMQSLKMPQTSNQHAHWDGRHIRRRLFDSWQEPVSGSMIPCNNAIGSDLVLHAGRLHSIEKDSIFEIFTSDSPDAELKDPIPTFTVTHVDTASSTLSPTSSTSTILTSDSKQSSWYARLWKTPGPGLRIYCDDADVWQKIIADCKSRLRASVSHTEDSEIADLCLTVKDGIVHIRRGRAFRKLSSCSPPLPQYPVYQIADIRDFINRYSHFISHLMTKGPISITSLVTIKMVKLMLDRGGVEEVVLPAVDDDGRTEVVRVLDTSLDFADQDSYGFTICSNRNTNLYVYLVYFDASKSDIEIWYSAQKSRFGDSADPCLGKDVSSELTLGYGNNLMAPLYLDIPDGEAEDVCFIKIYVATKAVDIGALEQRQFPQPDAKSRGARQRKLPIQFYDFEWASETIAIVTKSNKSMLSALKVLPKPEELKPLTEGISSLPHWLSVVLI